MRRREWVRALASHLAGFPMVGLVACGGPKDEPAVMDAGTDARAQDSAMTDSPSTDVGPVDGGGWSRESLEAVFAQADLDAIVAIGNAWLERLGDISQDEMTAALLPTIMLLQERTPEEAVDAAIDAIEVDFQQLRTTALAGWTLSTTETHLCAMLTLTLND